MKALAMMVGMIALVPLAYAEQGDAEDRALTEQMRMTHEQQPTQTDLKAAYGGNGKEITGSGHAVPKEKPEMKNGQ